MPVQVSFYDEPHVIVGFWSGDISAEDVVRFANDIRALMVDAKAPLFILADTTKVTRPYMNMGVIRAQMRNIMSDKSIEWLLGYGVKQPIVNFLLSFVARTFGLKIRSFESWAGAQAFLQSLDTDLDFSRTPAPPTHTR